MVHRHRLSQTQKLLQRMALTPQMRLSIKLLGMSTKDLNEYLDSALEQNPFLKKSLDKSRSSNSMAYEYKEGLDQQEEDHRSSLLSQLKMLDVNGKALEIAEYLIHDMDDNGYITSELEDAAEELSASIEEVEDCLAAIQKLEPVGIGARDIKECLQLQLKRMEKEDSLEYKIVSEFINELARNDAAKISKALGVDEENVNKAIAEVKKLNPRPASTILSKGAGYVMPDVIAVVKDKKIRLELNREWLPRLKFYNPYETESDVMADLETQKFIKENMLFARNLIDNLKRREETMCKVAEYILRFHQKDIVAETEEIKSLTIKNVSKALNLHPSTISRTVSNKFIQINEKVVPLKSFLSHEVKKTNGEITSKASVKKRIEALVKHEDKARPLSDKAIQEKLLLEGFDIKRRTVAKYRAASKILPTYLRKKL